MAMEDFGISSQLQVMATIKKKKSSDAQLSKISDLVSQFKSFESEDRLVLDFHATWEGFCNGRARDLMETFDESLYFSLAYTTMDSRDIVTDFYGKPVDRFNVTTSQGIPAFKYVKKYLRIVKIADPGRQVYLVRSFKLDMSLSEPIVAVLTLFSSGDDKVVPLSLFTRNK